MSGSLRSGTSIGEQLVAACIELVQQAEALRPQQLERVAVLALMCLDDATMDERAMLAFAIERACDELIGNRIALGISLPALCMAADQLVNGAAGIAAARFEIDTLLPLPGAPAASVTLLSSESLVRRAEATLGRMPVDPLAQLRARRVAREEGCPVALRSARARYDV